MTAFRRMDRGGWWWYRRHLTLPDGTEQFAEDIRYDQFNDRRRRPQEGQP